MSDGFAPLNNIEWQGANYGIAYPTSADKLLVFFHKHAIQNPTKSAQAGRPIFDEKDFVRIQHPGERDYIDRPITPADIQRWPDKWRSYVEQNTQQVNGTPIDLLFPRHPSVAANVRSAGFHTVEQLAEATSYGMSSLGMSAQDYVNAAQKYLDIAKRGVDHHQMKQALDERDQKIKMLEQQNQDLLKRLAAIEASMQNQHQPQVPHQVQPIQQVPQQLDFDLPPPPISLPDLPVIPNRKRIRAKM
jgi:hypothetical protein